MEHMTMRKLPQSEQPYEKVMRAGAESLSDAELLAVILRCGSRNGTAIDLAHEILREKQGTILNLNLMSLEELARIPGIGRVKAIQLKCIAEISKRMTAARYRKNLVVNDPATIAYYYMEQLRHEQRERLILAMFDTKNHFLGDEVLSIGTVNSSLVSPREVFLAALRHHAVHIILLHNHPSGDAAPSREDELITKRCAECGRMLGIPLADHIIIGDQCYTSFRECGLLQ